MPNIINADMTQALSGFWFCCSRFSIVFLSHPATRIKTAARNSFGTVYHTTNALHNTPNMQAQKYFS